MIICLAIVLCLLVSFTFSGIEAGILSVNRVRLLHRARLGEKPAIRLQKLLARPERLLVTVVIVTNLMNIAAIILSTRWIVWRIGVQGYVIAFLIWLPLSLLGLGLLPKSLFRRFPYRALAAFSESLRITDLLLSPFLNAGAWMMRAFFRKRDSASLKLFVAREDLKYWTGESERVGALTAVERQMIQNVLDFRAVTAREVMTPMAAVRTIRSDAPIGELMALSRVSGFDRLPVVSASGAMTGLVNVFEVLLDPAPVRSVEACQRRLVSVAAGEQGVSVIRKLRAARSSLAVVLDEAGNPIGVVTSEDLIARLVKTAVA